MFAKLLILKPVYLPLQQFQEHGAMAAVHLGCYFVPKIASFLAQNVGKLNSVPDEAYFMAQNVQASNFGKKKVCFSAAEKGCGQTWAGKGMFFCRKWRR